MGGDGAIYSTINGAGGPDPIAECDNCSRVIRYVVTYGARYEANALIQMRVHDVNVLTDLDAVNPMSPDPDAPVSYDGTHGSGLEEGHTNAETFSTDVQSDVDTYWTGPWPELHVVAHRTESSECQFNAHVKTDILGNFEVVELTADIYGVQSMADGEFSALQEDTQEVIKQIWNEKLFYAGLAVGVAWLAVIVGSFICQMTGNPWAFLIPLAMWVGAYITLIILTYMAFLEGGRTGLAASQWFALAVLSLMAALTSSLTGLILLGIKNPFQLAKYWAKSYRAVAAKSAPKGICLSGILVAAGLLLALALLLTALIAVS